MLDYNLKKEDMFYAKQFSELIKFPTVTRSGSENFAKMREKYKELCPLVWQNCEFTLLPEDVVILKWKGKSSDKPLVLMGHQDVVPAVGGEWTDPPFSGVIKDGKIWGRGTGDDKNSVYITMRAVEELMEDGFVPEQDIYLSYSDSEEQFGYGVENARDWYVENGIKPNLVIDEGGAMARANVAEKYLEKNIALLGCLEKGYIDIKFIARSAGGHSSTPKKNNPFERIAKLITYCSTHKLFKKKVTKTMVETIKGLADAAKKPYKGLLKQRWLIIPALRLFGAKLSNMIAAMLGTTMVFTQSSGSAAPNVLPQEAYVVANLRIMPWDKKEDVIAKLTKIAAKYDCEVEVITARDAYPEIDTTTEQFKLYTESLKKIFEPMAIVPYVMTGGTDCRVMQSICDNAFRCEPCYFDIKQLNAMHAANESIDIDSLCGGVRFFKYFIQIYK